MKLIIYTRKLNSQGKCNFGNMTIHAPGYKSALRIVKSIMKHIRKRDCIIGIVDNTVYGNIEFEFENDGEIWKCNLWDDNHGYYASILNEHKNKLDLEKLGEIRTPDAFLREINNKKEK